MSEGFLQCMFSCYSSACWVETSASDRVQRSGQTPKEDKTHKMQDTQEKIFFSKGTRLKIGHVLEKRVRAYGHLSEAHITVSLLGSRWPMMPLQLLCDAQGVTMHRLGITAVGNHKHYLLTLHKGADDQRTHLFFLIHPLK